MSRRTRTSPRARILAAFLLGGAGRIGLGGPSAAAADESCAVSGFQCGREYRFVWVQEAKKVGETLLSFEAVPAATPDAVPPRSGTDSAGTGGATASKSPAPKSVVRSQRTFDSPKLGFSQRSTGSTLVESGGTVSTFDETLDVTSAAGQGRSQLKTRFESSGAVLHARYTPNGKELPPLDVPLDKDTFVLGSQAVEHWILLGPRWALAAGGRPLKVVYPDFAKTYDLIVRRVGDETTQALGKTTEATRYDFGTKDRTLQGSAWIGRDGKLLQLEFAPQAQSPLRVTLAEEKSTAAPAGSPKPADPSAKK